MGTERQIILRQPPYSLNELYDKYAAMLLGYISGIVDDAKLAEEHLVSIYNKLSLDLSEINAEGCNVWCHLQKMAQKHLSGFYDEAKENNKPEQVDLSSYNTRNKFLGLMSDEQKLVFCYVYYKGKTTAQLAAELDRSEESIRKALKEAFAIIKKGS